MGVGVGVGVGGSITVFVERERERESTGSQYTQSMLHCVARLYVNCEHGAKGLTQHNTR